MNDRLPRLIEMHRRRLQEERRKQAEMQAMAATFRAQATALEGEMAREAALIVRQPELAHTLGAYLESARERKQRLVQSSLDVEREIERAQEALSEVYRDLKKFEVAQSYQERRQRDATRRRERRGEDEIGIQSFRRQSLSPA